MENGEDIEVPSHLKLTPLETEEATIHMLQSLFTQLSPDEVLIYCRELSPHFLEILTPLIDKSRIILVTTWRSNDIEVGDGESITKLYQDAWFKISATVPIDLRIYVIGDNNGDYPIRGNYFVVDGNTGWELSFAKSVLERGYSNIRSLSRDEVSEINEDVTPLLSARPPQYNGERLTIKIYQIERPRN